MSPKLRLLKVQVLPVFVVDDGDGLQEAQAEPIVVSGKDWPSFIEERWPGIVADFERQLDSGETPG